MMEVVHYLSASGSDVYQEWLDGIRDAATRVRITRRVERIAQGNFGDHKFEGMGSGKFAWISAPGTESITARSARQ
jgi:putative addiction module killer protein